MDKIDQLIGMVVELQREVREMRNERLNGSSVTPLLTDFSVAAFATKIGRSADWVYAQIRVRRIKVLPGGKPYRIPPSELQRFFTSGGTK